MNKREISSFCLNSISENSFVGYILEVDLQYSNKLYNLHNDYPLAPDKPEISQNMLSKYYSDIANKYGIKIVGVKKLVRNLRSKKICCSLQKSSVVFIIRDKTEQDS